MSASPRVGSITHLTTEMLLAETKLRMIHAPYKSTGTAMADLLAGNAPVIVGSLLPLIPQFQAGKLRPLAVTTAKRWPALRKNLDEQGMMPSGGTPAQFGERIRRDYERWRKLVDALKTDRVRAVPLAAAHSRPGASGRLRFSSGPIRSIGSGNTMVEPRSPATCVMVCR